MDSGSDLAKILLRDSSVTLCAPDAERYNSLTIHQFPTGDYEASWGLVSPKERYRSKANPGESDVQQAAAEGPTGPRAAANAERAARRARVQVRRRCMAMEADRLTTLTYRKNESDEDSCWEDFRKFLRSVQKKYPNYKYVVVAERQKRGAIHFHIATAGFQDVTFLRKTWRSVVGDGNIDVSYRRGKRRKSCQIARYIAKYIGKDVDDSRFNRHRYRCSEGLERKIVVTKFRLRSSAIDAAFLVLTEKVGHVSYFYESDDYPCGAAFGHT